MIKDIFMYSFDKISFKHSCPMLSLYFYDIRVAGDKLR